MEEEGGETEQPVINPFYPLDSTFLVQTVSKIGIGLATSVLVRPSCTPPPHFCSLFAGRSPKQQAHLEWGAKTGLDISSGEIQRDFFCRQSLKGQFLEQPVLHTNGSVLKCKPSHKGWKREENIFSFVSHLSPQ